MNLTVNVFDTSAYPLTSTPLAALGIVININGNIFNDVNTATQAITANTTATVTITKAGHKTYTNSFKVYETNTITLDIFLEPVVISSLDPDYLKVYPNFKIMYIPGSYNAQFVDLSSGTSFYNWYIDKALVSTDRNFIHNFLCASNHEIIQRLFTYNTTLVTAPVWWDSISWGGSNYYNIYETGVLITPLNLNTYNLENVVIEESKPQNTLTLEITNNACASDDCDCIPQDSTITVTPNVILNLNNQPFPTCATSELTYNLYDFDGALIDTLTHTIDNTLPIDNSTLTFDFTLSLIGDYTLETLLTNCSNTCTVTETIHNCAYIKIEETSCHVYTIKNCSDLVSKDSTVTVTDLDNNILEGYDDVTLDHATNVVLNTPSDGAYIVIIKDNLDTVVFNFVIIDICDVNACFQKRIQEMLCDCDCKKSTDCTDYCKKKYELERLKTLWYALFNKINRLYKLNSYFSVIDQTTLDDLVTQKQYIDEINSYCSSCGSGTSGISKILGSNSNNSNCGCS